MRERAFSEPCRALSVPLLTSSLMVTGSHECVMEGVFDLVFVLLGLVLLGISWYPWAKASHYIFPKLHYLLICYEGLDQMIGELGP